MKRFALAVVLLCTVFSLMFFSQVTAQTDQPKCDPTVVIKAANSLKTSGDNQKDIAALIKFREQITAADIACSGLTFKGTKVAKIIGPFDLPTGTYKVTATTPGYLIIHVRTVSGNCEQVSLYNLSSGEATTGSETLYESKGCRVMLLPSNISAPWTLTFEPLE
jgi:hypothetical protein